MDSGVFNIHKHGWPTNTQLAWPILGVHHFSDVNRALLLEAGVALNLSRGTAQRILEKLRNRITQEAQNLYEEIEAEDARIAKRQPYLSVTMTGELRCLRSIIYNIINEMVQRLD